MFLKFRKISEITIAVDFLFTEAGVYRFSTEKLFERLPSVLKKDSNMDVLLGKCLKYSNWLFFPKL